MWYVLMQNKLYDLMVVLIVLCLGPIVIIFLSISVESSSLTLIHFPLNCQFVHFNSV